MTATIVIARHGRTAWHSENRYAGASDIPVDEVGFRQADVLARWAGRFAPAAVFSSPLLRARQTAERAAAATGRPVLTDTRIRELDFGAAEGRTLAELDPDDVRRFKEDPVAAHLPGGEDPAAAADRAAAWVLGTAASNDGSRVFAVAHNTLVRLLVCRVLGAPLRDYRRVLPKLGSVALTRLRVDGDRIALESYNAPPLLSEGTEGAESLG